MEGSASLYIFKQGMFFHILIYCAYKSNMVIDVTAEGQLEDYFEEVSALLRCVRDQVVSTRGRKCTMLERILLIDSAHYNTLERS